MSWGGTAITIILAFLTGLFGFLLGASGTYPRVGRSPPLQRLSGMLLVMALSALTIVVAGSLILS